MTLTRLPASLRRIAPPLICTLLLGGCGAVPSVGAYRIEIQQGNYVTQEMVSQLKAGMTREQVRFILGTPLVSDLFHADRWDYVFVRRRANSDEVERRGFAVFFDDGKLQRIEGDVVAAGTLRPGGPDASPAQEAAKEPR